MEKLDREVILTAAHGIAAGIASNEATKRNLADELLTAMADAIDNGISIDIVWAEIARRCGYADKANKLEGVQMPSTLATYRGRHRKGADMGVTFRTTWPEFQKSLKGKLDQSNGTEAEKTETESAEADEVQLTSVIVPRGIAEIMHRYERLRVVNPAEAARFEADMNAAAAKWN